MIEVSTALARFVLAEAPAIPPPVPRAEVYRRLVRTNFDTVITNAFPVTEEVLGEGNFGRLIAAFLDAGGAKTSFFREIPGDFVEWVSAIEHPYADLMQYEWLDLLAQRHPADLDAIARSSADLIRPNPTMQIGVYRRPVHLIGREEPSPEPYAAEMAYLVWRRPIDDEIEFHRAGLLMASALAHAACEPASVGELAVRVHPRAPELALEDIARALDELCGDLRRRDGLI